MRGMKAVRHIVDGAKAMCSSLRSWLHRKDSLVNTLALTTLSRVVMKKHVLIDERTEKDSADGKENK